MHAVVSIPEAAVAAGLAGRGFTPSGDAVAGIRTYLELLMRWNKAMNLVGASTWQTALDDLILDSLHLASFLPALGMPENPACWDIGAGAGLPGIPLRLVWQEGTYTMIEVREKRALFMRTVLAALRLPRTAVFGGRAETFFARAGLADLILSRAFMPWEKMLSFVEPHLAPSGRAIFLALAAPPERVPPGWRLERDYAYTSGTKQRRFWSFTRCGGQFRDPAAGNAREV
jgi:16S rRNA (guanine527-N7)-methyltransferase